jgi:glycosyltransferase involved in cell wall biosynthesis
MPDSLILYDVDPVNPYGRELAAVLAADGKRDVRLACSRAVQWVPAGVRAMRVLAAPRSASSAPGVIVRRFLGVLLVVSAAARIRAPIVVVWSRDAWDTFVLAVFAALSRRVVVVEHNPMAQRRARGLKGRADRLLLRHARAVVVHDAALAGDGAGNDSRRVVTHPAYAEWRQRFLGADPVPRTDRVLLLGAVRPDKGATEIAVLLGQLPANTEVTVVGKGVLPSTWAQAAHSAGVHLAQVGGAEFVSDERLGVELARGGVVLAPYPGATQSGTVILAITCALPVLGYAAGALPSVLTDESLVDVGDVDVLAELLARYRDRPWPTARVTAAELTERCARDWAAVLALVE